jgi:hypothetical protein
MKQAPSATFVQFVKLTDRLFAWPLNLKFDLRNGVDIRRKIIDLRSPDG